MAVASGWAGRVLARPRFRGPSYVAHVHFKLHIQKKDTSLVILEKLPKAMLHPGLHYLQQFWFTQWPFLL